MLGGRKFDSSLNLLNFFIEYLKTEDEYLGNLLFHHYTERFFEFLYRLRNVVENGDSDEENFHPIIDHSYDEMLTKYYPGVAEELEYRMKDRENMHGKKLRTFISENRSNVSDLESELEDNFPINTNVTFEMNLVAALRYGNLRTRRLFIQEHWDYFKDELMNFYDKLENQFKVTGEFNMFGVYYLFFRLSNLHCGNLITELEDSVQPELDYHKTFLVVNENGEYGYSTYLRAFSNGITVIGIRMKGSEDHPEELCSYKFLVNEINISRSFQVDTNYKNLYSKVMNSDLTISRKKFMVFFLFVFLREIPYGTPVNEWNVPKLIDMYEYRKFKSIINRNQHIADMILEENENVKDKYVWRIFALGYYVVEKLLEGSNPNTILS